MKSAILAVGTELTSGQILNRNASSLSEKLKSAGLLTALHLTVPDDRKLIFDALNFCSERADLIFVTGGLGPTSDDFTRELISKWSGLELEFDPNSWRHVEERLTTRGYSAGEIQRQQCYFPKGSEILVNSQGTANAFYLEYKNQHIFVLPGPPREIQAIWQEHIEARLKLLTKDIDQHKTHSWDTMGFGESQIAERIEKIVAGTGFEIGYRVHIPYVEVKFSYFESERPRALKYLEEIELALNDCTVSRDGKDILNSLITKLCHFDRVEIYDSTTGGILTKRITAELKNFKSLVLSTDLAPEKISVNCIQLSIVLKSENQVRVAVRTSTIEKAENFSSNYNAIMSERRLQVFTERALIFWNESI